jgi:prophage tail gpP-like protein
MKFDYDKLADEFSFTSEFNPDIDEYRAAFKPMPQSTAIYIGGSLVINGRSWAVPSLTPPRKTVNVKGYGNPGVLTKSAIVAPFEFDEGSTFTDIITNIAGRFGLIVVIDPLAAELSAKPFEKRIQFSPSGAVGGKLIQLAKERGLVLSKTFNGRVLVTVPNTSAATVQAFVSGEGPVVDFDSGFNPDALDTSYIGYAPGSPDEATEAGIVTVDGYPQPGILPRIKGITPSEADNQTLPDAVRAERGRAFGEWMSPRLTVEGWRDKNSNLYTPNTIVTVKAPGAMVYEDTKFFVRAVTMIKPSNKKGAVLDLILPEAFTGRDLTIKV